MRKRNKLYTANKWNRPLFAQGIDRKNQNVFDGMFSSTLNTPTSVSSTSGLFSSPSGLNYQAPQLSNPNTSMPVDWSNAGQRITATQGVNTLVNNFGSEASQNNPFSKYLSSGNGDTGKAAAGKALMSVGMDMTGVIGKSEQNPRGLWDIADPVHQLAGGRESAVGNGLEDAGVSTFKAGAQSGNGYMMLAGAGLKVLGGLTNGAFGIKTDKARLNAINEGMNTLNNYNSTATSFEDVKGLEDIVDNVSNVYRGGWFSGHKASKKNDELRERLTQAKTHAYNNLNNNINNITNTQRDNLLANYAAFGGPLGGYGGAIDYGFMSDYLMTKDKAAQANNKVSTDPFDSLPVTPMSVFALGGDIQADGTDWSNGLVHIDAGGSHEESPYDGVQVGISTENGQPNLVEEGETIFDDYVFSKRIKADAKTKKKFHVGKNTNISYADLSKKLEKESLERPNDPISQNALKKQMHELADEQERQKGEQQAKEAQNVFEQLPPEQQQAIMQQVAMEEQQAMQQSQGDEQPTEQPQMEGQQEPQQIVDENMQQQMNPQMMENNGEQINACGGKMNRFDDGGDMKRAFYKALSPYVEGGIHTDSDFDKWLYDQKLDRITDWKNILKNKPFMDAVKAQNPALGDAIERGYDFGAYVPSNSGGYDLGAFSKVLGDYTASNVPGNTNGNYAIDKNFNYGNHKNIKELEADPKYKGYSDYMLGVINRAKGIRFKFNTDDHSYKGIEWADPNKNFSEDDYNALLTLADTANGTSTNPEGEPVNLFNTVDDYTSLADGADKIFKRLRYDGKAGRFHLTPTHRDRSKLVANYVTDENGKTEQIYGDVPKDWISKGSYSWQDKDTDHTANYFVRPSVKDVNGSKEEETELVPVHKNEKLRYAGLFGPAVGLGMQLAGVGKPDYSRMDAAVEATSGAPALASYKPIGNYIGYRPMDIWYEQNRMNANSRATDRAVLNNASPLGTKMAGLLANGYNSQIASGDLYRKALEYNDAQRQKVAEFNRGTDMYNADAFTKTSATNAQLQNSHKNFKALMMMDAARQRMAADAAWNQGIYGNVQGLFNGISDLGKENAQHNLITNMAADGIFGNMSDKQNIGHGWVVKRVPKGTKKSKGGRINRRKGLTF